MAKDTGPDSQDKGRVEVIRKNTQERDRSAESEVMSEVSVAASETPPEHPAHRKSLFDN